MKKILILLVALVAVFLVVVAVQPADFRITRSATIAAPPSAVYDLITNFQKWNDWSPWAKLDPAAKNTLSDPPAGVGASFAWSGNNEVGEGRMTITDTKLNESVLMKLEFTRPFAATNTTEFTLKPAGPGTEITWSMSGRNNFAAKAMCLIMNCDRMIGGKFEEGFANLRKVVEKPAP